MQFAVWKYCFLQYKKWLVHQTASKVRSDMSFEIEYVSLLPVLARSFVIFLTRAQSFLLILCLERQKSLKFWRKIIHFEGAHCWQYLLFVWQLWEFLMEKWEQFFGWNFWVLLPKLGIVLLHKSGAYGICLCGP